MKNYTGVEEQVEYGLETIDPNRKIEVSLKDLMFAYQTIGLLINFFHQPLHFSTLESVEKFLGDDNQGAYHLLSEVYYKRLYDIWPEDIRRGFDESRFDNPNPHPIITNLIPESSSLLRCSRPLNNSFNPTPLIAFVSSLSLQTQGGCFMRGAGLF